MAELNQLPKMPFILMNKKGESEYQLSQKLTKIKRA